MTSERLYYHDPRLRSFNARVLDSAPNSPALYLDRSAFYPASGGQPADRGHIDGIEVLDVIDEGDRVAHILARPLGELTPGAEVRGDIDWDRRFDHMQQHTGQHLLSAIVANELGYATVSFHMGADACTIDLECKALDRAQIEHLERRVNREIAENRPVTISFEDAATAPGLRKPSDRQGIIRVITIEDLDRSACGGTHVRTTGEIGCVLLRGQERVRDTLRLEFRCGLRAVARARADYSAVAEISRATCSEIDRTPERVKGLLQRVDEAEKARSKLALEVAGFRGLASYRETQPNVSGVRVLHRLATIDDSSRGEALAFTSNPLAVFSIVQEEPRAVLVACSSDSGIHAGNLLREVLKELGGRGGGSQTLAQGSVPPGTDLARLREMMAERLA